MTHPSDMTTWAEIACQRGPDHYHHVREITVDLSQPHGYSDLPQIPARLVPEPFTMYVWDTERHPVDGGPYCPAHDAVSETIVSHGVWEPCETILTLQVMQGGGLLVDVGAQIGWFSLLALASGGEAIAVDADRLPLNLLQMSAEANLWGSLETWRTRVDAKTFPFDARSIPVGLSQYRLVKIDIEGAESDGVAAMVPAIAAGLVDHLCIEVSPVFHDGYPELVSQIIGYGYEAWRMPLKSHPPALLETPDDLRPWRLDTLHPDALRSWVQGCHQATVWFKKQDASW